MPTLTQIAQWDVKHLEDAAAHWNKVANIWEEAYYNVRVETLTPGGTEWVGEAADMAQAHANHDYRKVVKVADGLRAKAATATRGAQDLESAKRAVLAEVKAARDADFSVEEDLSVHDTALANMMLPDRQAEARAHQAAIDAKVNALVALDGKIAAELAKDIGGLDFTPDGSTPLPPMSKPAMPQEYVKSWFEQNLGLNRGGGGTEVLDRPAVTPGLLDKLTNAQDCNSQELRDAWLNYISVSGQASFGLASIPAGGGVLGGAAAGFGALQFPGAWDTLMACYGIK